MWSDQTAKSVIVFEAGSGIGRSATLAFVEIGASIVLASRTQDGLERTASEAGRITKVIVQKCDVTDLNSVQSVIFRTLQHFRGIHVVLNAAGIVHPLGPVCLVDP
jgi:NADP-dependent 3-hydroxy acid dehydrogenase YdfG